MIKKLLLLILMAVAVLLAILIVNTIRFTADEGEVMAIPAPELTETAIEHFRQALGFRTVSYGDPTLFDSAEFLAFHDHLTKTYPLVHERLELEKVAGYSLLYKWAGSNADLRPVVIMAHQDVVPIEEATRDMWTVDPFGGEIKDGFIWGRGTTDDKINLVAVMEAVEKLLASGYTPANTVYLVFGHDEEIGGAGAVAIAALLKSRGIAAEFVLDEGGIITAEKVPGIQRPVALLGTAEKGYLSLKLTVAVAGGHSSMPLKETAIDILAAGLTRLRSNPFPADFSEPMRGLLESLGPHMAFAQRMVFANPWLFKSVILGAYSQSNTSDAMIRTTMVPTIIESGIKDNVVPTIATAVVNLRLSPGHSAEQATSEVKQKLADDRIEVAQLAFSSEASPVTPMRGPGYQKIAAIIRKSYPNVVASPFLVIGATDSRHFTEVSSNIIKFSPMVDPIGFHGIDERVSLESYRTALWFYEQLLVDLK